MGNICDRNKLCSLLLMANVGITDEMRSLSEIVEGKLYLGSCRAAQDWKVLQQLGITHVINVAASSTWYCVNYQEKRQEYVYYHLYLSDVDTENVLQHLNDVYTVIDCAVMNGGKVLIHCIQGRSRSAVFVIAYLMRKFGVKLSEALLLVQRKRPSVSPNNGFLNQLKEYEQFLADQSCI